MFGLVEYMMVLYWIFVVFDMYNMIFGKNVFDDGNGGKKVIYYFCVGVYYLCKVN